MGVLAYVPLLVGAGAVYSAYGSAKTTTDGGFLSVRKYARAYGLGGVAMVLGLLFGVTSLLGGEFVSGAVGVLGGFGALLVVVTIAVFDLGGKAAKQGAEFARENPEEAAQAVSAAASAVGAAAEAKQQYDQQKAEQAAERERKKKRQEAEKQQQEHEEWRQGVAQDVKLKADLFQMECPNCGLAWGVNSSGTLSGGAVYGMRITGVDDVLEKADVQCADCSHTRSVRVEQPGEWKAFVGAY